MTREKINRRVVMCDFDRRVDVKVLKIRWRYIADKLWPGVRFRLNYADSPSGRGVHFWAVAQGVDLADKHDILLAQCLMGSDVKRERMNLKRISQGIRDWNVLFCTKRVSLHNSAKKHLTKRK